MDANSHSPMDIADDKSNSFSRVRSLRLWIPLSVTMFVLIGSLSLLHIFERHRANEIRASFEEMARVNAGFFERAHLARSSRMAERLSEILGFTVFFWNEETDQLIEPPNTPLNTEMLNIDFNGRVQENIDGEMIIGIKSESGVHAIFVHDGIEQSFSLVSRDAWLALGIFWFLSLALGWALSIRVTQPLQRIVRMLPSVGGEGHLDSLPLKRKDEIGRLARTLHHTHETLQAERELRRQAERHAILGRMAANMAHEVRNPISAIRLHAQLMDKDALSEFESSKRLILSESARLESLVGQWINYARPEPPKRVNMEIAASLRDSIDLIQPQAKHSGVKLKFADTTGKSLTISADGQRLQQVFGNLLLNGVQSMPKGGELQIELMDLDDMVEVAISDQGGGFTDLALQHSGEPFYSEKEGGMGLGIAVAKDICEAHGGVLSAENRNGGGACVRVRLPISPSNKETRS